MHQLSESPEQEAGQLQRRLVLVDTDIGDDIDDALALALIARSPEIDLRGVTTVFGDTRQRALLAAHVLRIFEHREVPIAPGMSRPLQPRGQPSGVHQAAALDPQTTYTLSERSAPTLISETAMAHPGKLTLICLGPLTNVATALLTEPRLSRTLRNIVLMGGTGGFPLPEWNVRNDALAARIVLTSGAPITLIGMNITLRCRLRSEDLVHLHQRGTPQTALLCKLIAIWQRHRPRFQPALPYLHDPLTVVSLCAPELFQFQELAVRVPIHGPFKGFMFSRIPHGPLVNAVVDVRPDHARAWIMQRLLASQSQPTYFLDDARERGQ